MTLFYYNYIVIHVCIHKTVLISGYKPAGSISTINKCHLHMLHNNHIDCLDDIICFITLLITSTVLLLITMGTHSVFEMRVIE